MLIVLTYILFCRDYGYDDGDYDDEDTGDTVYYNSEESHDAGNFFTDQ